MDGFTSELVRNSIIMKFIDTQEVHLEWVTVLESNNDYFTAERSIDKR